MMTKRVSYLGLLAPMTIVGVGCLSEQGGSEQISILPARASITAGGAPVIFTASVPPDAGRIVWALEGPGALTTRGEASVAFTPPPTVPGLTSAVLSAILRSGARASAEIEISPADPVPPDGGTLPADEALRIMPASTAAFAGGPPIEFRAVLAGGMSAVTWSLVGPGSLSFPSPLVARYAPPADVASDTGAILTAQLSAPALTARANILVRRAVGNLALAVNIPSGISLRPSIAVSGPGGFARTVTASETLYGVVVGTYRAVAATEVAVGSIVTTAYVPRIIGSPGSVVAGGTARIEVTYTARRGSGHLWVADGPTMRLRAYGGAQLATSGAVTPAIQIEQAGGLGAALGSDGDLWVAADPFTVVKYAAAHLENGARPDVRLGMGTRGAALDYISGLAFDSSGSLWLASNPPPGPDPNRRILKFAASTLRSSDPNPAPEVTLRGTTSWYPISLAFDRAGNLWVADFTNDRLVKFAPAQLVSDGAPSPTTVLSNISPGNPLSSPIELAFDSDGSLWAANLSDARPADLVMYTATQAQAGGSPNPAIRIGRPTLPWARGLAFDVAGGLWMGIPGGLARLSRAQLLSGGAPPPDILVQDSSLSSALSLVFNPPPSGVPIYR